MINLAPAAAAAAALLFSFFAHSLHVPICLVQNPGFANCNATDSSLTYNGEVTDVQEFLILEMFIFIGCFSLYMGGSLSELHLVLGFDVDLIRWITNSSTNFSNAPNNKPWIEIPWRAGSPIINDDGNNDTYYYYFVCNESSSAFRAKNGLMVLNNSNNPKCYMVAGAITILASRILDYHVKFTYPYFRTSAAVLVSKEKESLEYNPWAFLRPFHWTIWVALGEL
jgi:hypothetical protein